MRFLILFLGVFILGCNAENENNNALIHELQYEIDSLKKRVQEEENGVTNEIKGTGFLPYSSKMIGLMNHGIEPIDFTIQKECEVKYIENENQYPIIKEAFLENHTLVIIVEIIGNACHNYLGEAELTDYNTLNLIYTDYGGFCSWGTVTLQFRLDTSLMDDENELKRVTVNGQDRYKTIEKR